MDRQQTAGKHRVGDGIKPSPYYKGKVEETRTIGEYVTELCAYYMAIGMPREQFLRGGDGCEDYEKAFECKQILDNRMLHLQGYYNYRALCSALSSAFAGKGKKGDPYLPYPVPITEPERKAEKERSIMRTLEIVRSRKRGKGNGG